MTTEKQTPGALAAECKRLAGEYAERHHESRNLLNRGNGDSLAYVTLCEAIDQLAALANTAVHSGDVTPEMIAAGAKAAREYMERTGGNSPAVIYRAMRAVALASTKPEDDYKAWYEEAMVASNEAGYVGLTAAQTIRELASATSQQKPAFYVRVHPDGTLTGDVLSAENIEPVRVRSGAWAPLYTSQANGWGTPQSSVLMSSASQQEPTCWYCGGISGQECQRPFDDVPCRRTAPPVQQAEPVAREPLTDAARDVLAERQRQVSAEGWTPQHDDEHGDGALARAAAVYANPDLWDVLGEGPIGWPEDWDGPKLSGQRRNLVKAGALILAEIERMDRVTIDAAKKKDTP